MEYENEINLYSGDNCCPYCGWEDCCDNCVPDDSEYDYYDDERAVEDSNYRNYSYDTCSTEAWEDRFEQ